MNYAEILKENIKRSKLKLDEIAQELNKRGLSGTREYLSRLQNGKVPPAGEEINRALAEITNGSADQLLFTAYIEKAPKEISDRFRLFLNPDILSSSSAISNQLANAISSNREIFNIYRKEIQKNIPDENKEEFFELTSSPKELIDLALFPLDSYKTLTRLMFGDPLFSSFTMFTLLNLNVHLYTVLIEKYPSSFKDNFYIENNEEELLKDYTAVSNLDESVEGLGAKTIVIRKQKIFNDGDLAYLVYEDPYTLEKTTTFRRIYSTLDGVLLITNNHSSYPITKKIEEIEIIGVAVEGRFPIKKL